MDISTLWEKLSKLKESHPMQSTEFAVAQGIDHELAFNGGLSMCSRKEIGLLPALESSRPDI